MTTKISSREFSQDVCRAKRAADRGPVVITDCGKPAYVLLRHETYRRLLGKTPSTRNLLGQPGAEDIEFDPPRKPNRRKHLPTTTAEKRGHAIWSCSR